jgi:hypothetical protein
MMNHSGDKGAQSYPHTMRHPCLHHWKTLTLECDVISKLTKKVFIEKGSKQTFVYV